MSHGVLRPNGTLITTPGDGGRVTFRDTVQCKHCGCHWTHQPGSGKVRGWCCNCNGPVCGPQCAECLPFERWLENVEAGRPEKARRIIAPSGFGG